jgi:hypothetical protein
MTSDFAPLLRSPLTVRISGQELQVPYQPAAVWAQGLDRLEFLVSLLADSETRDRIIDLRINDSRVRGDLERESLRILGEQTGMRWWEAGRLISTSVSPEVLGHLTLAGVDPWSVSVGQWCAAVYAVCTKDTDREGRTKFDFLLSIPPPGYEDQWDDGFDLEAAEAAYLAEQTQ